MLTREEISAEQKVLFAMYRQVINRCAALALADLLHVINEEAPTARWVSLSVTDQDLSGGVFPSVAIDAAGAFLTEELDSNCDIWDCDDRTIEVWGPPSELAVTTSVWNEAHPDADPDGLLHSDYVLDVDKLRVLAEELPPLELALR